MSAKRDGGQAFPIPEGEENHRTLGMSLRDYFAAKALEGYCVNSHVDIDMKLAAGTAYEIADAMLDARERPERIGDAAAVMLAALEKIRDLFGPMSVGNSPTEEKIWTLADEAIRGAKVAGVKLRENEGEVGP